MGRNEREEKWLQLEDVAVGVLLLLGDQISGGQQQQEEL